MSQITTEKELANCVNQLLEVANDTQLGYETAAEKVENPELKSLYRDYARQRQSFVSQLQDIAPISSATPELVTEPTLGGKMQAGWIGFREAINWESEKVVLAEIGKMENHAIGKVEGLLKDHHFTAPASDIVQHQLGLYREGAARAKDIYENPNNSNRGPVPGMHDDGTGTTAAGRARVPSA